MSEVKSASAPTITASPNPAKRRYVLQVEIPTRRSAVTPDIPVVGENVIRPAKRLRIPLSTDSSFVPTTHSKASTRSQSSSISSIPFSKGKGRAREMRRRSRSASASSLGWSSREGSFRSSTPRSTRRSSMLSSFDFAGPSGTRHISEDVKPIISTLEANTAANANLDILALASDFQADDQGAIELLADGGVGVVREGPTTTDGDLEIVKIETTEIGCRNEPEIEETPVLTKDIDERMIVAPRSRESSPGSASQCVICMTEMAEILSEAEEAGKGGIGGGLALWVCEQRSCGALFCVTCAVDWANRARARYQTASCPQCTRATDIDGLRAQARAYDSANPTDPIRDVPPRHMMGRVHQVLPGLLRAYLRTEQGQAAQQGDVMGWFRYMTMRAVEAGLMPAFELNVANLNNNQQAGEIFAAAHQFWRGHWVWEEHQRLEIMMREGSAFVATTVADLANQLNDDTYHSQGHIFRTMLRRVEARRLKSNRLGPMSAHDIRFYAVLRKYYREENSWEPLCRRLGPLLGRDCAAFGRLVRVAETLGDRYDDAVLPAVQNVGNALPAPARPLAPLMAQIAAPAAAPAQLIAPRPNVPGHVVAPIAPAIPAAANAREYIQRRNALLAMLQARNAAGRANSIAPQHRQQLYALLNAGNHGQPAPVPGYDLFRVRARANVQAPDRYFAVPRNAIDQHEQILEQVRVQERMVGEAIRRLDAGLDRVNAGQGGQARVRFAEQGLNGAAAPGHRAHEALRPALRARATAPGAPRMEPGVVRDADEGWVDQAL